MGEGWLRVAQRPRMGVGGESGPQAWGGGRDGAGQLVMGAHEDGVVRVWDLRSSRKPLSSMQVCLPPYTLHHVHDHVPNILSYVDHTQTMICDECFLWSFFARR